MKYLAPLLALLLAGVSAFGTTVTSLVVNITGDITPAPTNVLFTPTGLGNTGSAISAGTAKLVGITNGFFSTEIVPGKYTVLIRPMPAAVVHVPASGTWDLRQLMALSGAIPKDSQYVPSGGGTVTGLIRFESLIAAGIVPQHLTTAQRDGRSWSNGVIIWNITLNTNQIRSGGTWVNLPGGGGSSGSGGSLTTNANQFGASEQLTIKSGAQMTNTVFRAPVTYPLASSSSATVLWESNLVSGVFTYLSWAPQPLPFTNYRLGSESNPWSEVRASAGFVPSLYGRSAVFTNSLTTSNLAVSKITFPDGSSMTTFSGLTTNFTQGGITWTLTNGLITAVSY